ncbi:MAG: sigma-70 family RNA polymerase sigma factor [Xanthobacteraceae bacterium]|jgi:RNA polymerase sigma-70 factor (ECF subfamily)
MSADKSEREGIRVSLTEQVSASDLAACIGAIAARQDRAAFAELFKFYAPRIKTMLMRAGAAAEVAEELAQDTLLVVWRKAAQYDPSRASAAAWIFTIARNLRTDKLRQEQRAKLFAMHETSDTEEPERPDDVFENSEQQARVRAALCELPEEQLRVVQLSFIEGRVHGDIAKLLNLPLGTVKSRLRLAMSRLRNLLGEPS